MNMGLSGSYAVMQVTYPFAQPTQQANRFHGRKRKGEVLNRRLVQCGHKAQVDERRAARSLPPGQRTLFIQQLPDSRRKTAPENKVRCHIQ